jgi:hypothetical protein
MKKALQQEYDAAVRESAFSAECCFEFFTPHNCNATRDAILRMKQARLALRAWTEKHSSPPAASFPNSQDPAIKPAGGTPL